MAKFQQTIASPDVKVQTPSLQTNTGSTAGDVIAGLQFGLGLVQSSQEKARKDALFQEKALNNQEIQAGTVQAQKDLAALNQTQGTKQSLLARKQQQLALNNLSPTAISAYTETLKASGVTLAVAQAQEDQQVLLRQQQKNQQSLIQEGREFVLAASAGSSPEFRTVLEKYADDGFTEQELAEIAN